MPTPILDLKPVRALKASLQAIDTEISKGTLDQLVDWAFQPVKLLAELHVLAIRAINGDRAAAASMFKRISLHTHSHESSPGPGRSASTTRSARGINIDPVGGGPVPFDPCGPSPLPGPFGEIALAISAHTPRDASMRNELLDGLRGLGDCTGAFDSLSETLDRGDLDRALEKMQDLRSEYQRRGGRVGYTPEPDGPSGWDPEGGFPEVFPIPDPCPEAPITDPCKVEREFCFNEIIDYFRNPPEMPDGSHVYSDGITGVTANVCAGDTIRISGSGFGATQPDHIRVLVTREVDGARTCEEVRVISWSDRRIDVEAPDGVVTGCVGFLDLDKLAEQQQIANQANLRLADLNSLSACLRSGPISAMLPIPSETDCPPCIETNSVVAGPPVIRLFRGLALDGSATADAGYSGKTVIEPGQDLELRWDVFNATRIKIERTSATGPRFGSANSVTDPVGNSYDLGTASHTSPRVWTYKMTVTNRCGTVEAEILVAATVQPELTFGSVEVTQGIQTIPATVALVAEKRTVVRVFWNHGLNGFGGNVLPNVTGQLAVRRDGNFLGSLHPINGSNPTAAVSGATITVPANPLRVNVDDSLNFLIPAAWCTGTLELIASARVEGYGAAPGEPDTGLSDFASQNVGSYSFNTRTPINLEYLRVRWRGSDNQLRTPTVTACEQTLINSMQRIAAPIGSVSEHPDSPLRPGGTHDDDAMEDLVDDWEWRHRCEITDAILGFSGTPWTFWCHRWSPDVIHAVGEAYWAIMPGNFYRGIAGGIPAATYSTPARTAPDTGWTAQRLDTKAAHELSHCLDQKHIRLCGAKGGNRARVLSNNSAIQDVAFDIAVNGTMANATDLMSYCSPRWTHPDRWSRVYGYVGG